MQRFFFSVLSWTGSHLKQYKEDGKAIDRNYTQISNIRSLTYLLK
ncbi:hypothetical protein [Thalassoporum mexicanum]|nr:hypothetical protein [Pseudanabaena sp. PCC 7367]